MERFSSCRRTSTTSPKRGDSSYNTVPLECSGGGSKGATHRGGRIRPGDQPRITGRFCRSLIRTPLPDRDGVVFLAENHVVVNLPGKRKQCLLTVIPLDSASVWSERNMILYTSAAPVSEQAAVTPNVSDLFLPWTLFPRRMKVPKSYSPDVTQS